MIADSGKKMGTTGGNQSGCNLCGMIRSSEHNRLREVN